MTSPSPARAPRIAFMRLLTVLGMAVPLLALPGCAVVTVAGAAAGAAVSVTGAVVSTGVTVAGKVATTAIDLAVPDGDEE